jgi:DegV family protein with EDD domain
MQILTDSAADLTPAQLKELNIEVLPMTLTLDGKSYLSGVDLQPDEFYDLVNKTDGFPTTSQPSAGEFAEIYRRMAKKDPEIFSIHISSGLSGTLLAAQAGAQMVPEAKVTFYDTFTLSSPEGWMVQAAAHMLRQNWSMESIFARLDQFKARTQGLFTLSTLKYLIHGGRISHLRGLVANMLNVKPIIGPEKVHGKYTSFAQDVTWKRVMNRFPDVVSKLLPLGSKVRVQFLHGQNLESVEMLREVMLRNFTCQFDPVSVVAPVLGAHTGPSVVGMAVGDPELFEGLF